MTFLAVLTIIRPNIKPNIMEINPLDPLLSVPDKLQSFCFVFPYIVCSIQCLFLTHHLYGHGKNAAPLTLFLVFTAHYNALMQLQTYNHMYDGNYVVNLGELKRVVKGINSRI